MGEGLQLISDEAIISKIYVIRGRKVMIDRELAQLYDVETRVLNQAVKRNNKRFPEDFMFQMTKEEMQEWKSQIVISNKENMGLRKPPLVFTEQGVAMLSSVLNSDRAIQVNIQIIRVFTKMRELFASHKEIMARLEQLEKNDIDQDGSIRLIFDYLKQLEKARRDEQEYRDRQQIGFKRKKEE